MKRTMTALLAALMLFAMAAPAFAGTGHHHSHAAGSSSSGDALIGTDAARQAALKDAGVSASNASFQTTVRYTKQGTQVYKVVFLTDTTRHVYEINAYSGAVYSHHTTPRGNSGGSGSGSGSSSTSGDAAEYIGEAQARAIALAHAGVAESSVTKIESKLKSKDGRMVYDIEFRTGSGKDCKYEYRIDAVTGEVIEWEQK